MYFLERFLSLVLIPASIGYIIVFLSMLLIHKFKRQKRSKWIYASHELIEDGENIFIFYIMFEFFNRFNIKRYVYKYRDADDLNNFKYELEYDLSDCVHMFYFWDKYKKFESKDI